MKNRTEEYYKRNGNTYKRIIEHFTGMRDSIRWEVRRPGAQDFSPVSWFADEPNDNQLETDVRNGRI